jgi:hypothetical protein
MTFSKHVGHKWACSTTSWSQFWSQLPLVLTARSTPDSEGPSSALSSSPRPDAHPRSQMFGRGKCYFCWSNLRDDLLHRIHTEPWQLRQTLHDVLMGAQQARHLLLDRDRQEFFAETTVRPYDHLRLCNVNDAPFSSIAYRDSRYFTRSSFSTSVRPRLKNRS